VRWGWWLLFLSFYTAISLVFIASTVHKHGHERRGHDLVSGLLLSIAYDIYPPVILLVTLQVIMTRKNE
jgi:hypothetical protein